MEREIMKLLFFTVLSLTVLFSVQYVNAEELPLPEGKNIKEWESISAALVAEKRFDEAIIYLDKILEQDPVNLKTLSNKAGLLIQLEKFSESVIISDRVLEIDPDRVSTLTNKAIALKMLKEYESSFLVFSKIISLEPENEAAKNSRAKLLSLTPTASTNGSNYEVHGQVIVRNENGDLVGTVESTNSRYLPSIFTEKWWERLDQEGHVKDTDDGEIFTKTNPIVPSGVSENYLGMLTLERHMSGYAINIFELFLPMMQLEETDTAIVQWTIIKN